MGLRTGTYTIASWAGLSAALCNANTDEALATFARVPNDRSDRQIGDEWLVMEASNGQYRIQNKTYGTYATYKYPGRVDDHVQGVPRDMAINYGGLWKITEESGGYVISTPEGNNLCWTVNYQMPGTPIVLGGVAYDQKSRWTFDHSMIRPTFFFDFGFLPQVSSKKMEVLIIHESQNNLGLSIIDTINEVCRPLQSLLSDNLRVMVGECNYRRASESTRYRFSELTSFDSLLHPQGPLPRWKESENSLVTATLQAALRVSWSYEANKVLILNVKSLTIKHDDPLLDLMDSLSELGFLVFMPGNRTTESTPVFLKLAQQASRSLLLCTPQVVQQFIMSPLKDSNGRSLVQENSFDIKIWDSTVESFDQSNEDITPRRRANSTGMTRNDEEDNYRIPAISGTIAIRSLNGFYVKLTQRRGARGDLECRSRTLNEHAHFVVINQSNGKVCLRGYNGYLMTCFMSGDIKCWGPGGGVDLGIIDLGHGLVNFSVSGYAGQKSRTGYLSTRPGRDDSTLSLQYVEDETCRFRIVHL
ncbi:hypothetical protein AcV5_006328 [Taiwanofungus camphoratus]|nr:hypothetical protein AcV5_006328 [Antrodia cinnamomea]